MGRSEAIETAARALVAYSHARDIDLMTMDSEPLSVDGEWARLLVALRGALALPPDPPALEVALWEDYRRLLGALAERDAEIARLKEEAAARVTLIATMGSHIGEFRRQLAERDELLARMAKVLHMFGDYAKGVYCNPWDTCRFVLARYAKMTPPGATGNTEPASGRSGASGGATESEGPEAGAAKATCAQPGPLPGTASGSSLLSRDPAVPTGSLLARVREALAEMNMLQGNVTDVSGILRDLDAWAAKARRDRLHDGDWQYPDALRLLRELLGDRP